MSALKISCIVGNPKAASRTLDVALEVSRQLAVLARQQGHEVEESKLDLATLGAKLLDWGDADAQAEVQRAAESDLLVVASPVYKAAYTGLLKLFLDLFPPNGLSQVTAIPLMLAAAPIHALAVELHLRPVLLELGASCPTRGLFVLESQLPDLSQVVTKWLEQESGRLSRVIG